MTEPGCQVVETLAGIAHGFFDRRGGVSKAPFDSLDVGHGEGKDEHLVAENRNRVLKCFSSMNALSPLKQVHGDRIVRAEAGWGRRDGLPDEKAPEADAVISNVPGLLLMIQTADCQPVLLWDPEHHAVGAVHSGWRGSVANIVGKTVTAMEDAFGTRPEALRVGVGASLGPCCAEFVNFRLELPEAFHSYETSENRFDFWAITKAQLLDAGVDKANIGFLGACTRCGEHWFSFRRERETGRLAAVIGVPESPGG